MKYIIDGENPEQKLILNSLEDEDGYPIYCSENLITHTEEGTFNGDAFDVGTECFYDMMYDTITENKEMPVKPEHAAKIIGVIETAHAANPLTVKF